MSNTEIHLINIAHQLKRIANAMEESNRMVKDLGGINEVKN